MPFGKLLLTLQQSTSLRTSDTRRSLAQLDEGELFMELIKDIANELDIDVLCHKILVNVELLTHADRGSLFLVRGNSTQSRYLHAKLFDVCQDTGEEMNLPSASEREKLSLCENSTRIEMKKFFLIFYIMFVCFTHKSLLSLNPSILRVCE